MVLREAKYVGGGGSTPQGSSWCWPGSELDTPLVRRKLDSGDHVYLWFALNCYTIGLTRSLIMSSSTQHGIKLNYDWF